MRSSRSAARVPVMKTEDEVQTLATAFNRMTGRLEEQTNELRGANTQLETRRAFIEAVLSSVTAGVIAVDSQHAILLLNRSAGSKLEQYPEELVAGFTENFARLMARLAEHHPDQRVYQPSQFFMETVARLFLNTVREMLRQNLPLPEMQKIAVEITAYDFYGYMGLLKLQGMDPRLIDN